ncbi:MAG TPA: hypothetical protein VH374_16560 [Polyangia bacterium]|nr:hypothetical protein [Polyangia bacterium]
MNYFVEVAQVVNGQVASVKVLSKRRQRWQMVVAASFTLSVFLAALALNTLVFIAFHRVVFGPVYLSLWGTIAFLAAFLAARRARDRSRRYVVGARIDDDAFAPINLDLVSGERGGVGLTVAPGMTGSLFGGRAPVLL